MSARLLFHQKVWFGKRYLMEMTIYDVGRSVRYPDGVKYGLIAIDTHTEKRVLIDNHHPKGHHLHLDEHQIPYEYIDDDRLIEDFRRIVREHLGAEL